MLTIDEKESMTLVHALLAADGGDPFTRPEFDHLANGTGVVVPHFVRAQLYEYEYEYDYDSSSSSDSTSTIASKKNKKNKKTDGWEHGRWWRRKLVREYVPPIEANNPSVKQFLQQFNMH